jgi:hypothetical protein
MTDPKEQLRLDKRAADTRKRRKNRGEELEFDPSAMPSLSARRALARMYVTGRYTTQQVHELTQSDNPTGVLRQLYIRRYVRATGTDRDKKWSLTPEGVRRAEALRAAGFDDFLPPKLPPRLSPEDVHHAPRRRGGAHSPPPVVSSRAAVRLFLSGASASEYLTPTQKRLLTAVAGQPGGLAKTKPNERTADALVRFKLAERTPAGFQITESGQFAAKEIS